MDLSTKLDSFASGLETFKKTYDARVRELEQRADAGRFGSGGGEETKSLGQQVVESASFEHFQKGGFRSSGKIECKTALVSGPFGTVGQALVPPTYYPGIVRQPEQQLRVRDLLPTFPTSSNLVEFTRESSETLSAAPQYSAGAYENVVKAESAMAFQLASQPVTTIAHWLPVTKQLLDDAPGLSAFINARLTYGLKLAEESELLNGSGLQGHLSGLVTNATSFASPLHALTGDQDLDTIAAAIAQLQAANFQRNWVDFESGQLVGRIRKG